MENKKLVKVTLRQKTISGERKSLYLDFYPPIPDPQTGKLTRREFLNLHIMAKPKTPLEKQSNKERLMLAEQIRQKRETILHNPEKIKNSEKRDNIIIHGNFSRFDPEDDQFVTIYNPSNGDRRIIIGPIGMEDYTNCIWSNDDQGLVIDHLYPSTKLKSFFRVFHRKSFRDWLELNNAIVTHNPMYYQ